MNINDKESKKEVELLEQFIYEAVLPEILKSQENLVAGVKSFDYKELFRKVCKCGEENQPEFATMLREDILNSAFYAVLDELVEKKIILSLPTNYECDVDIDKLIEKQVKSEDMQKIFRYMDKSYKEKGYYELNMQKYFYEEIPKSEQTYETQQRLYHLVNQLVHVLFKAEVAMCICDDVYVFDKGLNDIERFSRNIYKDSLNDLNNKVKEVCKGEDVLHKGYFDKRSEEVLKSIYKLVGIKFRNTDVKIQSSNDEFALINEEYLKKNMLEVSVNSLTSVANDYLLRKDVEEFLKENSKLYNELIEKENGEEPNA